MKTLHEALKSTPVVYVTRDLERAVGLPQEYQNYYIITNFSPYAKELAKNTKNTLLIKERSLLDTRELLEHPRVAAFINKLKNPHVIVFKNTLHIEKICADHGWPLLNPPSYLGNRIEEKISQVAWLGNLKKYLPLHQVMLCKDLPRVGASIANVHASLQACIIQFNRAHTGNGTMRVTSEDSIQELRKKFPQREVRVTTFIDGSAFTLIGCVWGNKILTSTINYQITGLPPFTHSPFATIGNDWALPQKILTTQQTKQIRQIATDVGEKLITNNWRGLFGIDVIVERETGKVFLIEINARQQAGATFESYLQQAVILSPSHIRVSPRLRRDENIKEPKSSSLSSLRAVASYDDNSITTFEAHLAALLNIPFKNQKILPIKNGAQIIDRVKESTITEKELQLRIKKLKNLKLHTLVYSNTTPGADHVRIQNQHGIMTDHNVFNALGEKIRAIFTPTKPALLKK